MRIALGTMMVLLAVAAPAQAQAPINLSVRVTELSQIFTQLYGPEGLVVNSLTPLETGETHSGHFNSGFESEFSQFGTALTGQIVSLPLPPPASGFTYGSTPVSASSRAPRAASARSCPSATRRSAAIASRSASRISACRSTRSRGSTSAASPPSSPTTTPNCAAGART